MKVFFNKKKIKSINIANKLINFIIISDFEEINFSYGISEDGWICTFNDQSRLIKWKDENYICFLRVLELPYSLVIDKVKKGSKFQEISDFQLSELFPIEGVIKTAFFMKSNYWANLGIEFLRKAVFFEPNIIAFLEDVINQSWIKQKLKHNIRKYIKSAGVIDDPVGGGYAQ